MNHKIHSEIVQEMRDQQGDCSRSRAAAGSLQPSVDVQESSDRAESFLLNYTASCRWEDMEGIDWTTSEVHELLAKYIKENKEIPQ